MQKPKKLGPEHDLEGRYGSHIVRKARGHYQKRAHEEVLIFAQGNYISYDISSKAWFQHFQVSFDPVLLET